MSETAAEPVATELNLREESAQSPGSLRVDKANHVIRGVKLLGDTSKNVHPVSGKPYKYTDPALSGFAALQEGARVYINHRKKGDKNPREYGDQFGDFRDVKAQLNSAPRGTFGDLHYNPAHPLTEQILHDAEHAPHRLAMSHDALGAGRAGDKWHLVEEAKSVASVDLVCRGATNVSLYESAAPTIQPPVKPKDTTKMDKLLEQNKALTERVAKLEGDIQKRDRCDTRAKALKAAGVTADAKLMEHLVSVNDEAAVVVIESLKAANAANPTSRDPNKPVEPFASNDDFNSRIGV